MSGWVGGKIAFYGLFSLILWLVLGTPCSGWSSPSEKPSEKESEEINLVMSAAEADFPALLSAALKDGQGLGYGFKPGDDPATVSLGTPLRVYGLDSSLAEKDLKRCKVVDLVAPVGEWIFPVVVGREYRTVFGVRLTDGGWKGLYLGNPRLAWRIHDLRAAWNTGDRDNFLLVSCPEPRGFLFTVTTRSEENLTPLTRIALSEGHALAPPEDLRNLKNASETLESLSLQWRTSAETREE